MDATFHDLNADNGPGWPGEVVREQITIGEHTYLIDRPDHCLPSGVGGHAPCWAAPWPAARMLARAVLSEPWTSHGCERREVLEIGCGLGLPGLAALSIGFRVTFSDCDPMALRFAAANARLNGFNDFQTSLMDWNYPPKDMHVPVILASDLVYEVRSVEPVVQLIKTILSPRGVCLLTAQERLASATLSGALAHSGLAVETQTMREMGAEGRRVKGVLFRIQHDESAQKTELKCSTSC